MAMHPEITERLRAEVLQYCGTSSTPTIESLKDMKYSVLIYYTARLTR